jgi:hypothetical protein
MENQPFSWENQLLMVMFNSYVKLPEGNLCGQRQSMMTPNFGVNGHR